MVDMKAVQEIATSQYVFAILFILLLFVAYKSVKSYLADIKKENVEREKEIKALYAEHREESKNREITLMNHLERSNESQEKTTVTLEKIEMSLHSLEKKMDQGFDDVWNHFDKIDNK